MDGATLDHFSFFLAAVASAVAAAGVWWLRQQVGLSRKLAVTAFEDSLVEEYRSILKDLPVEALVSMSQDHAEITCHLVGFYRYFDLCNQQVFLRLRPADSAPDEPRITDAVWRDWREGMEAHMHRPSFQYAWSIIGEGTLASDPRVSFFNGFRALRSGLFEPDPADWPADWAQQLHARLGSVKDPVTDGAPSPGV